MKRLFILFCPAILLAGCVAVPYDLDSPVYAGYPTTVTAHATGSYYYDTDRVYPYAYPYAAPHYSRPYPYPSYPQYQPPAYTPPAPVIVPPTLEFRYNRNTQPGWQNRAHPRHDQFRNGPQPDWRHPGTPRSNWEYRHDRSPDGQQRDWGRKDWGRRDGGPSHWHGGGSRRR